MSVSKVPEITLLFCFIKIAATTLGEIGGDSLDVDYTFEGEADSTTESTFVKTESHSYHQGK